MSDYYSSLKSMSVFKTKKESASEAFEQASDEYRLSKALAAKFRAISAEKVPKVIPHLLEDDRIACEYMASEKDGVKLLVGGYFRYYDPEDDMIYFSRYKKPAQVGLLAALGSKRVFYNTWRVSAIRMFYIKISTENRIKAAVLEAKSTVRHSTSAGNLTALASPRVLQRHNATVHLSMSASKK